MKSQVQRLLELETAMTVHDGGYVMGAKTAFDQVYGTYGYHGVKALHDAGYDEPTKLWDFYRDCKRSDSEMMSRINFSYPDDT